MNKTTIMLLGILLIICLKGLNTQLNSNIDFSILPPLSLHSLQRPFNSINPTWISGGSTLVTEEFIRLTPPSQSKIGWLWNTPAFRLTDWEITVSFKLSGGRFGADGIAMWIVTDPMWKTGPVVGFRNNWNGLAIIFDSFDNDGKSDNPSVVIIMNDGTKEYTSDGANIRIGGCVSNFRNVDTQAKISYNGQQLEILMANGNDKFVHCDRIPLIFPHSNQYHIGFTGATGGLFDSQDIYSVITRGHFDYEKQETGKSAKFVDELLNKIENTKVPETQSITPIVQTQIEEQKQPEIIEVINEQPKEEIVQIQSDIKKDLPTEQLNQQQPNQQESNQQETKQNVMKGSSTYVELKANEVEYKEIQKSTTENVQTNEKTNNQIENETSTGYLKKLELQLEQANKQIELLSQQQKDLINSLQNFKQNFATLITTVSNIHTEQVQQKTQLNKPVDCKIDFIQIENKLEQIDKNSKNQETLTKKLQSDITSINVISKDTLNKLPDIDQGVKIKTMQTKLQTISQVIDDTNRLINEIKKLVVPSWQWSTVIIMILLFLITIMLCTQMFNGKPKSRGYLP
eukprot:TRINITY_DN1322_c3_g1_i1.p1 TRINITY_DN1322_c3_g1~~TRINITY_DN1322_c3_g1_i1.p1  ORF type:complete len:595 (-),score=244.82 TRINITY_DN1322_c3_g1_i1:42-1757(-)